MEELLIKRKPYKVISLLKEDELFKSYKCEYKSETKFVKVFSDKPAFLADQANYKALKKCGIKMPKLQKVDKNSLILVYEFIEEETAFDALLKHDLEDVYFDKLFEMYRFARFSKIELDYFPTNFVIHKGELYYLSHFFSEQNKDKNLENFGIFYWFYSQELVKYLKERNIPVDSNRVLPKAEVNKKIVLTSIMKW